MIYLRVYRMGPSLFMMFLYMLLMTRLVRSEENNDFCKSIRSSQVKAALHAALLPFVGTNLMENDTNVNVCETVYSFISVASPAVSGDICVYPVCPAL